MYKLLYILLLFCGLLLTTNSIFELIRQDDLPAPFYIVLLLVGFFMIFLGWRGTRASRIWNKGIRQVLIMALLVYAIGEVTLNALVWTKNLNPIPPTFNHGFGYFNGPCASYDPIRGFRWNPGEHRITKIVNDVVIYDQFFEINNAGIYASQDYLPAKKDSTTLRYLVFGDSFTAAEFLENPWHEQVNRMAAEQGAGFELYAFGVNGGGLVNWHRTFFLELKDQYDYDGIIFAIFGNDLERDFFVMHHTDTDGLTGYLDTVPGSAAELLSDLGDELQPYAPFKPDEVIDREIADVRQKEARSFDFRPGCYVAKAIISLPFIVIQRRQFDQFMRPLLAPVSEIPEYEDFIQDTEHKTPEYEDLIQDLELKHLQLLDTILEHCQTDQKSIIISTLPYKDALPYQRNNMELITYTHAKTLANQYGATYIDASKIYESMTPKAAEADFLPYDIHWNQQGSDRFAELIFNALTNVK